MIVEVGTKFMSRVAKSTDKSSISMVELWLKFILAHLLCQCLKTSHKILLKNYMNFAPHTSRTLCLTNKPIKILARQISTKVLNINSLKKLSFIATLINHNAALLIETLKMYSITSKTGLLVQSLMKLPSQALVVVSSSEMILMMTKFATLMMKRKRKKKRKRNNLPHQANSCLIWIAKVL